MKTRSFIALLCLLLGALAGIGALTIARTTEPPALQDRIAKLKAEINSVPLSAGNYSERIQTLRDWGNLLTDRGHFLTQQDLQLGFIRLPDANEQAEAAVKQWVRVLSFIEEKGAQMGTLVRGDVILTGTPSGVGPLSAGDVVEVEIEGIGVLRNHVA